MGFIGTGIDLNGDGEQMPLLEWVCLGAEKGNAVACLLRRRSVVLLVFAYRFRTPNV